MIMRKSYHAPEVQVEKLDVGVFGDYGNGGGCGPGHGHGHGQWHPIGWFNPFFGLCCGG